MVSQAEKRRMQEYLMDRLNGSGDRVELKKARAVGNLDSDFILIGDSGVILLIDRPYVADSLAGFVSIFSRLTFARRNIGFLFYKDGKTFFRNAAHGEEAGLKGKRYKATFNLSLKEYNNGQINRIISFRPEETYVQEKRDKRVQYYQPLSEGLNEGIEHFVFNNVVFDYSHISSNSRYGPEVTESKRLFIWDDTKRKHWEGSLSLYHGLVLPRGRVEELKAKEQQS